MPNSILQVADPSSGTLPQLVFEPEISVACTGVLGTCSDVSLYDLNRKPSAVYSRCIECAGSITLEGKSVVFPLNVPSINCSEKMGTFTKMQRFPPTCMN